MTNIDERYPRLFFEKIVSCIIDLNKKPLDQCSVLDLGCKDGAASFAVSDYGAKKITAIEGRQANLTKAKQFQKKSKYTNIEFQLSDVRNLDFEEKSFDIVLALGILYHLDASDIFRFVENLFRWTKGITIIDTHIAYLPKLKHSYNGKEYFGLKYQESVSNETDDDAIGNVQSFWLTRASLYNLLTNVGYTGIYLSIYPRGGKWREFDDRLTIIATREPRPKTMQKSANFEERDLRAVIMEQVNIETL